MNSKKSKTVTIESPDGRLRLAWRDGSPKRRTMAIGMPDTPQGRALAKKIKGEIETDLAIGEGHYDQTLLKYRPQTLGKNATGISAPELFDRFTKHQAKAKNLSPFTVSAKYKAISARLLEHLDVPAAGVTSHSAEKFADMCDRSLSSSTAKQRIWLLKSCWDWARDRYQVADANPWAGISDRFQPEIKDQVEPFTKDEVVAILQGFRVSPYYSHYLDFVAFLLGTGCRPGEAVGLRWSSIPKDFSTITICRSMTNGVERPPKTKKSRTVSLMPSTAAMLRSRFESSQADPNDLVFTSPTGLPLDIHGFRRRAWTQVLKDAGIPYRKPYATRHTAISHALANGANYIDVAKATGHNPQVMHTHYANSINKNSVFVDFGNSAIDVSNKDKVD
jgi:integrase